LEQWNTIKRGAVIAPVGLGGLVSGAENAKWIAEMEK
jgi:hypothetical protein